MSFGVSEVIAEAVEAGVQIMQAYFEYQQLEDAKHNLGEVIQNSMQFGSELEEIEERNKERQKEFWGEAWDAKEDVVYESCDDQIARSNLSKRWNLAETRDSLMDSTNMYSSGLREFYVNKIIGISAHTHSQAYVAARYHEDSHEFDTWDKYLNLLFITIRNVPYGPLPAYLGRLGNAYESLVEMHSVSMNNAIAGAVGSIDRMLHVDSTANTSRSERYSDQYNVTYGSDNISRIDYNTSNSNINVVSSVGDPYTTNITTTGE